MHHPLAFTIGIALIPLGAVGAVRAQAPAPDAPRTHVVEMVDFAFKPAELVVHPGDTIRFVQTTVSPHNVEFVKVPKGTQLLGPEPAAKGTAALPATLTVGPFLLTPGEEYDVVIADEFAPGEHRYICTPHEPMGMKGKIVVFPRENR